MSNTEVSGRFVLVKEIDVGGQHLFNLLPNLLPDVQRSLSVYGDTTQIKLHRPVPAEVQTTGSEKYMPPYSIIAKVVDPDISRSIEEQGPIAVTQQVAYHVVSLAATKDPWVVGIWNAPPANTPAEEAEIIALSCTALTFAIVDDPDAFRLADQLTQGPGAAASPMERIFNATASIDAKYWQHETNPCITLYMAPISANAEAVEQLNTLLRMKTLIIDLASLTPKSRTGEAPECVLCKAADHQVCQTSRMAPLRRAEDVVDAVADAAAAAAEVVEVTVVAAAVMGMAAAGPAEVAVVVEDAEAVEAKRGMSSSTAPKHVTVAHPK
ncbi:hypothetical protein DFH09DRAFT_1328342 [Mycena vulgaris]|nr:hypothetical protein DFH09DRAFT_1328342 [Mycena vulgaris]